MPDIAFLCPSESQKPDLVVLNNESCRRSFTIMSRINTTLLRAHNNINLQAFSARGILSTGTVADGPGLDATLGLFIWTYPSASEAAVVILGARSPDNPYVSTTCN